MSDKSLKDVFQSINGLKKDISVSKAVILTSNPLSAQILNDEKLHLNSRLLIVPEHLTDYSVNINIDGEMKRATIHNSLRAGDTVYILGYNSGKKYFVLGRV